MLDTDARTKVVTYALEPYRNQQKVTEKKRIFENGRKSAEINKKLTDFDQKFGQNRPIWTKFGQFGPNLVKFGQQVNNGFFENGFVTVC